MKKQTGLTIIQTMIIVAIFGIFGAVGLGAWEQSQKENSEMTKGR